VPTVEGTDVRGTKVLVAAGIGAIGRLLIQQLAEAGHQVEQLELEVVRELGCHRAQGFAVAPPLPAVETEAFLAARARWSTSRQTGRLLSLAS
jgi:EAL domain-containing protein (putative c-di-GMP-specific phosphodiesterase class I)